MNVTEITKFLAVCGAGRWALLQKLRVLNQAKPAFSGLHQCMLT